MGRKEINIEKYVAEVKRNLNLQVSDDLIEKDLLLTFLLAEFQKQNGIFKNLVFKGGTLLSRNYLNYHRFSEDLDFVYQNSSKLRKLARSSREKEIKKFIDVFVPKLKEVSDILELDFSINRSNQKYCSILSGRTVYIFRLYYSESRYIKLEINFIEQMINKPVMLSIKTITDYFDSKELMFVLGLNVDNFQVWSYPLKEIILEKYRAILTRPVFQERDLFDLFLIKDSLKVDTFEVIKKLFFSLLIKKDLVNLIRSRLELLNNGVFFNSNENVEELAIVYYNKNKFKEFELGITQILIKICNGFLKEYDSQLNKQISRKI